MVSGCISWYIPRDRLMPRVRMYPKHPFSQQCMCSIQNFLIQGSVSFGSTTILAVGLGAVIVIICLVVILVCCIRRWAAQWLLTWKNARFENSLTTPDIWAQHCWILSCNIVQRWILSRTFKDDINLDYGIYSEDGDIVVAEDRNAEYEGTQERQENVYDVLFQ